MSLRSEFRVVMSVMISASPRIRRYLQLFVGCLVYVFCVCSHIVVQHICCCVFVLFVFVLCHVLSVSPDSPFLIAPSVFTFVSYYYGFKRPILVKVIENAIKPGNRYSMRTQIN